MPRVIAHVDMDAFYASIEIRDNPKLVGRPVVVGGPGNQRGVVAAASYEARKYGIRSAMPMWRAERLCKQLVRVDGNMAKYTHASRQVMAILRSFSPLVEPLSLDEAFLDLTGSELALGEPRAVGLRIKDEIRAATQLTASVGIAPVKFVAKIASDFQKPDGLVIVEEHELESFLRPLPIARLWGVGPKTEEALQTLGFRTVGDLADAEPGRLERHFGENGRHLAALARGRDERDVVPSWDAKSYSHEQTFARDLTDREQLESVLLDQAVRVARRLRKDGVEGRVVQLKLRFADFHTISRQVTLPHATADADLIFEQVRALFREAWEERAIRLIGVGVTHMQAEGSDNLDLFRPPEVDSRKRKLADVIDQIEDRFGRGKVTRAKTLKVDEIEDTGTPNDRSFD
ncbi:MAG: DNA polymerase IV [Candidatus Eisenbacteria bacterium]|nr:DNA polymerase IV [Candidatus Eisenbacteria bacterium]